MACNPPQYLPFGEHTIRCISFASPVASGGGSAAGRMRIFRVKRLTLRALPHSDSFVKFDGCGVTELYGECVALFLFLYRY